ncbi:hypothetical protein J2J97_31955 (plasmid) [Rhizobium bangladeshense]|uniref:hypothetical protein n=1 Tax=Rhizobium bangladeshense TaxID=1138189 RepID=UPI001A992FAF|nr:hypothetical protein [Rhizobium bangladeshense]QSY98687.1 hypothetical protein J2J97_31955 [Rhizobium bangladeshense]
MTEPQVRQRRRVDLNPTAEEVAEARQVETVHEGFVSVQRSSYGIEEESNEKIRVPLFATEVARIRVNAGTTRNLGDFNSARVDVMIEMPCYPIESEIVRTYHFIEGMLDQIIPVELEKAGVVTNPDGYQDGGYQESAH